jgi:hypothetical protein
MGFLRYWRDVLVMAFRHSLDITQTLLFVGLLLAGIASLCLPALRPMITGISSWQAAALLLGAIVIARLIMAPYWLHASQAAEINRLHGLQSPLPLPSTTIQAPGRIEILSAPGAPYERSDIVGDRPKSTVAIGLRNAGGAPLTNIRVSIEKIAPALVHVRADSIGLEDRGFSLRSDESERVVDVAVYWPHLKKWRFLEPEAGMFAQATRFVEADVPRKIIIRVTSAEGSKAAMFDLSLDATETLRLRFVIAELLRPDSRIAESKAAVMENPEDVARAALIDSLLGPDIVQRHINALAPDFPTLRPFVRIRRYGWTVEKAMLTPVKVRGPYKMKKR